MRAHVHFLQTMYKEGEKLRNCAHTGLCDKWDEGVCWSCTCASCQRRRSDAREEMGTNLRTAREAEGHCDMRSGIWHPTVSEAGRSTRAVRLRRRRKLSFVQLHRKTKLILVEAARGPGSKNWLRGFPINSAGCLYVSALAHWATRGHSTGLLNTMVTAGLSSLHHLHQTAVCYPRKFEVVLPTETFW